MTTDYQPRFINYARVNGMTPDAMAATRFGAGFINWISAQRAAFAKAHPEHMQGPTIRNQPAFCRWLDALPVEAAQ